MPTVTGLDIGQWGIRAVTLSSQGKAVAVEQYLEEVIGQRELSDALSAVLARLPKRTSLSVTISLEHTRLRGVEFPFRDNEKIRESIKFKLESSIDWDIDSCVVDFAQAGEMGDGCRVLACAALHETVSDIVSTCQKAGFDPPEVGVDAFALANLFLERVEGTPRAFALVDVASSGSKIVIVCDGQVHAVRSLRQGLTWMASVLEQRGGLSAEEAQAARLDTEANLKISRLRDDALEEIGKQIQRTLISSRTPGKVECVYLAGTGSMIPNIDAVLNQVVDPDVVTLSSIGGFGKGKQESVPAEYANALGQALVGAGHKHVSLNLRQEAMAFKGYEVKLRQMMVACSIILVVLFGVLSWYNLRESKRLGASTNELVGKQWEKFDELFPGKTFYRKNGLSVKKAMQTETKSLAQKVVAEGPEGKERVSGLGAVKELVKAIPRDIPLVYRFVKMDQSGGQLEGEVDTFAQAERVANAITKSGQMSASNPSSTKQPSGKIRFSLKLTFPKKDKS